MAAEKTLIVACGALAREIVAVIKANTWPNLTLTCLPAAWHNRPELIPDGVRRKIREGCEAGFDRIFVAYGDCGTGGLLDKVLEEEGDADPTCFYLTDYLARHFQRLIIEGLWLDRHPDLLPAYFGHYSKLVYLAQTEDPVLDRLAEAAAEHLGLAYERVATGMGELDSFLRQAAA